MRLNRKLPKHGIAKPYVQRQTQTSSKETKPAGAQGSTPATAGGLLGRLQNAFDRGTQNTGKLLGQAMQDLGQAAGQAITQQGNSELAQQLRSQLSAMPQAPVPTPQPAPGEAPARPASFVPMGGIQGSLKQASLRNEGGFGSGSGSSGSIDKRYYKQIDKYRELNASKATMKETVNLNGSKADRMKALSNFTQFDTQYSKESDANACGATCIVTGAAIQGGKEGLQNLVKVIEHHGNKTAIPGGFETKIPEYDKLAGIKERINSGTVTKQDLSDLKTIVYRQLRKVEKDGGMKFDNATIDVDAMKEYVNTDVNSWYESADKPMKGMFDKMNIKLVNTTGQKNGPGHFVLFFNDGGGTAENSMYDPWPHKNGGQITQDPNEMGHFHRGVYNALR